MNNPTWVDRLTGGIPGKTEGVSALALITNAIFAVLCAFGIICLSAEAIASINGIFLAIIGATLGSKVTRTETTLNQVQAAQTNSVEAAAANKEPLA
jgi:hypothetical protein